MSPHLELQPLLVSIAGLPNPYVRCCAILGLFHLLPKGDAAATDVPLIPSLGRVSAPAEPALRGQYIRSDDSTVFVDPATRLTRSDFIDLVCDVAALPEQASRELAVMHLVDTIVATPDWVSW